MVALRISELAVRVAADAGASPIRAMTAETSASLVDGGIAAEGSAA